MAVVLQAFLRPPFVSAEGEHVSQSDISISLHHRTLKTFFLLALATGRRRAWILAIDFNELVFDRGDRPGQKQVRLVFHATISWQNQSASKVSEPLWVPEIKFLVSNDPERFFVPS